MTLNVTGGEITEKEAKAYLDRGNEMFGSMLSGMDVEVLSDEEVKVTYHILSARPFERVRRITGYLVGTLDKWNDAKRAEEKERMKHGTNWGSGGTDAGSMEGLRALRHMPKEELLR